MNIIDPILWAILLLALILGYYQGAVKSALMACGGLVSILGAQIFYPSLARSIGTNADIVGKLIYYAEGSEMIGGIRIASLPADKMTGEILDRVIAGDWVLPHVPLNEHLGRVYYENVMNRVFSAGGAVNLGDYLCNTIAQMTVNLVSYVMVFLMIFAVCTVVIYMCDHVFVLPTLRLGDGIVGAAFGLGTGFLVLAALYLLVPAILSYMPVTFVRELVEASALSELFLGGNPLLGSIPGYIG